MRRFKCACIQISGKGKLLFNYGQEFTESQVNDCEELLKDGAIIEIQEAEAPVEAESPTHPDIIVEKPRKQAK